MSFAAIWDLNGVIIDDMLIHYDSYKEVLAEMGYELNMEDYNARGVGASMLQVFSGLLPLVPKPIPIEKAIEMKLESYFRLAKDRMAILPGVAQMVRGLSEIGFSQAIASGATAIEIDVILKEFSIDTYFAARVGVEDVTKGKPDPEPFATAAQRLGVPPKKCVVFEDGIFGINGAKAAGMRTVGITNTLPAEDIAAADVVVDSLEQISPQDIVRVIETGVLA